MLWSERATAFPADEVHKDGQTSPQVVLFVGTLVKSFGGMSLSGSSPCKWYINPDIPDTRKLLARCYAHIDSHIFRFPVFIQQLLITSYLLFPDSAKPGYKPIVWSEGSSAAIQKEPAQEKKSLRFWISIHLSIRYKLQTLHAFHATSILSFCYQGFIRSFYVYSHSGIYCKLHSLLTHVAICRKLSL